ncbi:thiol reductant ABC exporter subunit CydC [Brevibacterium sp. BDJS002]|uniref:thiol reductant ABC exporter subunit CydC n=1 Tax=Brevibacterium sp. BDJS002 TaxID=3020906 RepID=UPI002307BFE2|nr:thiol reductant ABC exporter subunit CydC [Brevibacterium sp. BDJS002]MDN5773904.1 thiol reductant ABC exporter subunit CydC [Brevibacterium aurantiacum]WCE38700.1 thiol reductant ABC exporter subunit CydC [Brevibacterium sp. BDJS002]
MSSPLRILLDLPGGRRGLCLSVFSALARAVGSVLIAEALVRLIIGTSPVAVWAVLGLLGAALRGVNLWADHSLGTSLAAVNKQRLRSSILSSLLTGRGQPRMNTAVTVTRGIDDLDDYFTTVVPALAAAAVVPVTLLVRIVFTDVLSAVIIALCLPLVPIFMILIGRFTEESTAASTTALERLSDHLAELAEGLPVLIGLGRSRDHARTLRALGEKYHGANLATLRIAFLSSLALELIATISVALVAVVIGLRLVSGTMDLSSGLFVLLLAPECFTPLRELGAGYHASENGREAQARAHALIESTESEPPEGPDRDSATSSEAHDETTEVRHRVVYPNRTTIEWSGDFRESPGITAVRGPSGAGKSTILSALAGNLPAQARTTVAPRRVAFVPQAPRFFGATIGAELDVYGLPHDLQTAALSRARLPVDTHLSTSALSPGQLRRLAFVRVQHLIDDDATALVLDEPTAHLDDENSEIIIGMIAEAATRVRVILASHDDRVVALAGDEIVPSRPNELGSALRNSATAHTRARSADSGMVAQPASANVSETASAAGGEVPAVPSSEDGTQGTDTAAANREFAAEEPRAKLRRRWSLLRSSMPLFTPNMIIALLASCASSLAAIALTAVSAWLIVEASYQPPIMILLVAIVGVRFFGLSRSVLLYLSRLKLHSAIFASLGRLRSRLWEHFEAVGMGDRKLLTSDAALRTMVSDADDVRDLIPRTLFPPIASALVFIAVLIAAWALDPASLPVFLILGGLNLILLPAAVIRSESGLARGVRTARNRILSVLARALNATADLRTNRGVGTVLTALGREEQELRRVQRRSSHHLGIAQLWLQLSTVGAAVLIALTSSAPTEIRAVVVLIALGCADVFSQSMLAFRALPSLGVVLDRLPAMPPAQSERCSSNENGTWASNGGERAAGSSFTALNLESMSVGWEAGPVVEDVDLRARTGQWTVLHGDSGTGKSTTLSVLLRFLDPWTGSYRAEDEAGRETDVLSLAPSDLAGRIAWCPQEAHIFRSTVRGNLAIARSGTPTTEEMCEALTRAGLGEWADAAGLDLWVGDHGADISGGQRQRLAVARTILSGAEVIVLDEPTAHLDDEMAHRLVADLRMSLDSHAVVMVTHDRSLIAEGDRLVELGDELSRASSRT